MGCAAAIASVALGAEFIEKHFTLSREDGGVDAAFSLEPDELAGLVQQTKIAWKALGSSDFQRGDAEASVFRRSIYIVKNMLSGDVLTEECIRVIRPGYGLPPSDLVRVLGRTLVADASRGTPLSWSLLSE
jgi:N-acetylneuraminate synthase